MDSDGDLLDQWCAGDRRAGEVLFRRYFDLMYRFFQSKVQGEVDELVQATFLACVRGRDKFRREASFRTFLFAIARHELFAFIRRRHRDGERLDFTTTSMADLETTPRTRIKRSQDARILLHALRRLPLEQQLLLELFYWEELSTAELAEVFEVAPVTARTRLHRARKDLRDHVQALEDTPLPDSASVEDMDAWVRALREKSARNDRPDRPGPPEH